MSDVGGVHSPLTKPRLFKREQAEEFVDEPANGLDAALTPRPNLRRDQIEHWHAEAFQMPREAQMKIGIVGENCRGRRVCARVTQQFSILAVNARKVNDHFGESHNREAGRVNDRLNA